MQIGTLSALLASASEEASAKNKDVSREIAIEDTATHRYTMKLEAQVWYANPTLSIESKRPNGERYDPTKKIKVEVDPTAESPSQYAVYKLTPFQFKAGIETIEPKKLHDSIEWTGMRTGKVHKPLPTLADALAQDQGPIRIFTVERAILAGPTYDAIKENESGFATVLGDSHGEVLPLWGSMTLESLDLFPENDVQDQLRALVDAISKGMTKSRSLGVLIHQPATALNESSLNYTSECLRAWAYDPNFSLYTYVRIRLVAVIEPLPTGKFRFGGSEVSKGDDKLEVFKDPWLMKGVQGCNNDGDNPFLGFGDYMFCKEHLIEHLTKGPKGKKAIPSKVKLSDLMSALLPHVHSTSTGKKGGKLPPKACVRMGQTPVNPSEPFKLTLVKGAACTTDAATMRRDIAQATQSMAEQVATGVVKRARFCITDSRLGDVEPDTVYATEANFNNALVDTSALPENFPQFMLEAYSVQNADDDFLAFVDDPTTSPSGSFSFRGSAWNTMYQHPLFWTCFLLWTGCNCKMPTDLGALMNSNARYQEGTGDEKRLRDASCGLLGLMIAILLRIRQNFLTEDAAGNFKVVVAIFRPELNSELDALKILQTIMMDRFSSLRGVQINRSAVPSDAQLDEWIYVAYRMTREDPVSNDISEALTELRNAPEDGLAEAKAYLSGRLLPGP